MSEDLIEICQATAKTYGQMLGRFRPCKPGSEYLEQNLITLFCHEFLNHYQDGMAYTELPFRKAGSQTWSARLDGYLVAGDTEYLLEAKGFYNRNGLFKRLDDDFARIADSGLEDSLSEMAVGHETDGRCFIRPAKKVGIVMAHCWSDSVAELWEGTEPLANSKGEPFLNVNNLVRRSFHIRQFEKHSLKMLVGWHQMKGL